jgi:hypothetical protein
VVEVEEHESPVQARYTHSFFIEGDFW